MTGGNPTPVNGTANLIHRGRPKGAKGKATRLLRQALIYAAEKSVHSKSSNLEGYCLYLADKRPELFVSLLGRLIPVQARVDTSHSGPPNLNLINVTMPVEEMVRVFQQRIQSAYAPPTIEHDPENAFNDEEKPE